MPKKPAQKVYEELVTFLLFSFSVAMLFLSSFAIQLYLSNNEGRNSDVLGTQIDLENEKEVWTKYLTDNPEYFPGWLELAEIEEALGNSGESIKAREKANAISPQ